jgi:flagellar hook-associated protein 3 FlgL
MRVPTHQSSSAVLAQIQRAGVRQAQLQLQVSTGQRLRSIDEDPASAGRVIAMQAERARIIQFDRNADRAQEVSQASFAGLKALQQVSERAGEIVTLGGGISSPDALRAYAVEVNQLIEQAVQAGNSRLRDDYLFSGTATDTAPFAVTRDPGTGRVTTVAYAGNSDRPTISISEITELPMGASAATNSGIRDFISGLVDLRDALASLSTSAVASTRPSLEAAENALLSGVSENGAVELRVQAIRLQQRARAENLEQLVSRESDADLAETMVRLGQATTAYEASLSSANRILQLSILDYLK